MASVFAETASRKSRSAALIVAAVNALPTLLDALTTSRDRERELEARAHDLLVAGQALHEAVGKWEKPEQGWFTPAVLSAGERWFALARNALSSKDQDQKGSGE